MFSLRTLYFILCPSSFVPCTSSFVLCTLYFVLRTLYFVLRPLSLVLSLHFHLKSHHHVAVVLAQERECLEGLAVAHAANQVKDNEQAVGVEGDV